MRTTAFLLVLVCVLSAEAVPLQTKLKKCRLLINEWNAGTTDPELQFVELKAYCSHLPKMKSSVDMSRYRLVVMNPLQEVMLMCLTTQVKSFKSKTEFYFTYGGSKVANADVRFSECQIDSFLQHTRQLYLPTGLSYPFVIALLYNQRLDALNITELDVVEERYKSKLLPESEFKKVSAWIQDLYIYGSSTKLLTCDVYKRMLSFHDVQSLRIVRDWQTSSAEDFSVNRCTDFEDIRPFRETSIRHARPTPGETNACSEGFQYFIEDSVPGLPEMQKVILPMHGKQTVCYAATSDPETRTIITTPENFEAQMEIAEEENNGVEPMDVDPVCNQEPACSYVAPSQVSSEFDIDLSLISYTGNKFIWENCNQFPQAWKEELQRDTDTPLDMSILEDTNVCFWYEYLTDRKVGRCKLCNALLAQGIMYKSRIDKLMREGYLYRTQTKNRKNINKRRILHHMDSDIHKISLQYFRNIDLGFRGENLTTAMMDPQGPYYKYFSPTQNLLICVYQAVKMGLSFRSFKIFTETLKFFEINIGHVHNNEAGMKTILMHIEKMMRRDLANYLRLHKPEVSITLDSSTDVAGKPSLAVLFQTFVDKNSPKVFFYRLLSLKGESGVELFKAFKEALQEDGLEQYVRENISGYVSDGCSVMTSTFLEELRSWAVNGFINTWCISHRIELVSKNSLRKLPIVKHIEGKINSLATFFGNISPKKRRVLDEAAIKYGYRTFKIQRIHDIRWSQSKHKSMSTIMGRWKVIVDALQKIAVDKAFKKDTRISASALLTSFTDGAFVSTLAFLVDVSEIFTESSLLLQQRSTTLIGKRSLMLSMKERLTMLRTGSGPSLSLLLQNSLVEESMPHVPSLEEFETKNISYFGKRLTPSGLYNITEHLSQNRFDYVNRMTDQINVYFQETAVTNFDIFDPLQMERNVDNINYGNLELTAMNTAYRWQYNINQLLADWRIVRQNIVYHSDFPSLAVEKPESFWIYFLDFDDDEIGWTQNSRSLIRKVLSVGASSSEAERVFSVSNAQKTKRRYNLKVETLNALVAIRINGVNDIKRLDSFRYAKEFVREHAKADDSSRKASSSAADEEDFFLVPFDPEQSEDLE